MTLQKTRMLWKPLSSEHKSIMNTLIIEERKKKEIEWADKKRSIHPTDSKQARKYLANMKYYSVVRKRTEFINRWIQENCRDKDVFEMGCGNGCYAPNISEISKSCTAADI